MNGKRARKLRMLAGWDTDQDKGSNPYFRKYKELKRVVNRSMIRFEFSRKCTRVEVTHE